MPIEDGLPDIPLEGGTVNINITTSQHKTVPSSSAESPQQQYTSTIDDSKLVTVTSSMSSTPSSITTSSPVYSPLSSPRSHSPSSSSMDGISALHKRSRGSISSHSGSGSGSDTDDDERATKRHQSDSDIDSIASDETRTHESIVTIKYGEHAIRVLTIEDGTRVVVAKDFLLLTGISKENCARTTKNLIEGKDKRMMHVPSSYCMNKGQQAVVLTCSGLSQLLVTSRRLKQSAALQAWIKQTLMPALQGHATTATSTNHTTTEHVLMQSQSQAHNKINTKSKNGRTIVKAKRSVGKSPSASPVVKAAPAPLALSPTTSSFSPFIRSPSSSSSSASSSPIRPTFSRLSSSDSESTMSDASTSSSTPSSPSSLSSSLSSSGMQELSAAADMMLIAPNNPMPMPLAKPLPLHFPMSIPLMPTFSRIHPTFPYRTPLMPAPTMAGIGMGIRPTFTAGKIWAAGA